VGLDFRVLGPLEVVRDGRPLALGGARRRALLALLLLEAGEIVATDRIVEELWQGASEAARSVQVYVSQLRQLLGEADRLRGEAGGYRLLAAPEEIDARRFQRLLEEGRRLRVAGEHERAADTLRQALALWRGAPLVDLADAPSAQVETARLEELRLAAREELIEVELALGRHHEVLADIEALVAAEPLRERPRRQLMLALYRAGRQAHALSVYREARRLLVEELGLEPGHELRELQAAILRQERSLLVEPAEVRARRRLPAPPSDLVGRRAEVAEVVELIGDGSRLVTLTGPGGTGKTRVALQAAHELAERFQDGVWWVALAAVTDPELVEPTIARAVEAKNGLAEHLRPRQALLLLDNFEQVVEGAPCVAELLREAPDLKVLVTSRAPLRVAGEWEYPVAPLPEEDAVVLFCARARAVNPAFVCDQHVGEICRRLDGLPLAVELAAARSKVLPPAQLLERLGQRLPLLTGGPRDAPARQRTVRATVAWSYDLLVQAERRLFAQLAVFAGGWTLEAAEDVCGAELETLASLVDKSLVRQQEGRFEMLETIREYALEKLEESGAAHALRGRHAESFCRLVERAGPRLEGPEQEEWLHVVAREHENVRAALEWSLPESAPALAGRIAASLLRYWQVRGHLNEGRRWVERALASSGGHPPALELSLLKCLSVLQHDQGDFEGMDETTRKRLALAREVDDQGEVGRCLNNLGLVAMRQGDLRRASSLLEECITVSRHAGVRIDVPLLNLASIARREGDYERAERLLAESLEIARARGDLEQILRTTTELAWNSLYQGEDEEAAARTREAIELAEKLQHRGEQRECAELLAVVLVGKGAPVSAAQLFGKAEALGQELGFYDPEANPLLEKAHTHARQALGEKRWAAELSAGRDSNLDELLRHAGEEMVEPAGAAPA
jgi:predicted ATPase/DNA-binding SARP family transcriptional activator